jgi:hypothetical protein
MGIAIGTTLTVTFDARQIAQLDCLLQEVETLTYNDSPERKRITEDRVNNVFKALHAAGYR